MPGMGKAKHPPTSIRIAEDLKNRVADFAARSELSFNAAIGTLLEAGLTRSVAPIPRASRVEKPAGPKGKRQAAGPGQEVCEHRVDLGSFCPRCSGLLH